MPGKGENNNDDVHDVIYSDTIRIITPKHILKDVKAYYQKALISEAANIEGYINYINDSTELIAESAQKINLYYKMINLCDKCIENYSEKLNKFILDTHKYIHDNSRAFEDVKVQVKISKKLSK